MDAWFNNGKHSINCSKTLKILQAENIKDTILGLITKIKEILLEKNNYYQSNHLNSIY